MVQDAALRQGLQALGEGRWTELAAQWVPSRTGKQCQYRWRRALGSGSSAGQYTEDDEVKVCTTKSLVKFWHHFHSETRPIIIPSQQRRLAGSMAKAQCLLMKEYTAKQVQIPESGTLLSRRQKIHH